MGMVAEPQTTGNTVPPATPRPSTFSNSSKEGTSPSKNRSSRASSATTMFSTRESWISCSRSSISAGISPSSALPLSYIHAVSVSRSAMPWKPSAAPMGISSGATPAPKASCSSPSTVSKSVCSRSSLFTNTRRGSPRSAACRQRSTVAWSSPLDASTTNTARSAAAMAPTASPAKSKVPGVSSRLILWSCHSRVARAVVSEWPTSFSSGSWSHTVDPSSTRPTRDTVPAR